MTKSALLLLLALAGLPAAAFADKYEVQVPDTKWKISFQAPHMELRAPQAPALFSASNDRLQITASADAPKCPGDDSAQKVYDCFASSLKTSPGVDWDTERANTLPNGGVLVMYLSEFESNGAKGRAFNAHFLQAREGRWVDVHVSMMSPGEGDVQAVVDIVNSVSIEAVKPHSKGPSVPEDQRGSRVDDPISAGPDDRH